MKLRYVAAIGLLGLSLSACENGYVKPLPSPPKVAVLPTTTTVPDFSGTSLAAVKGTTTTQPVQVSGGTSVITGKVTVDGAPTGGVNIRIDRFVGDSSAGLTTTSAADGTYSFNGLQGGRYRVRAYRSPDATLVSPSVFFLNAGQTSTQNMNLTKFGGTPSVGYNIAPNPPMLGDVANVVVQVTNQGVDANGTARSMGQAGVAITLTSQGGRTILSPNPVLTDGNGKAVWEIRCDSLGGQGLTALMPDGTSTNVNVAACVPPPTTTTAPPQ